VIFRPAAPAFEITGGEGLVIACALHAGHDVRPSIRANLALDESARLREEDPFTDRIADIGVKLVRVARTRFEVDLNRSRRRAVYRGPDDVWGLDVWRTELPPEEVAASLALHDHFYDRLEQLLGETVEAFGCAVVFDIHSYNHRRGGPDAPPAIPEANPEVNLGTGSLDRCRWGSLAGEVSRQLSSAGLEVRENVRFKGGHLAHWAHERFNGDVCVLALEFKKTFMDEWTGEVDNAHIERLRASLAACVPIVLESTSVSTRSGSILGA
jgi:N-formylglutamate deformylase